MKRKAYGRDAGLSLRMLFTGALLSALYVGFAVVLFQVLNVGLVPMILIVVGLAFFQYYTSDKLALLAAGAKIVSGGRSNNENNGVPIWIIILLVSLVTYVISYILIRAISRYREYAADRGSALITGAPEHLMSALQKISSQMTTIPQQDLREVAGMNAFFIIPTWRSSLGALFADHPPLEKRLARLAEIAREMG